MTVLKARVAGAWQTIGNGAMIPAGGAAGDLLTKNSAANFDAVWGTAIPSLTLNNPQTLSTITAAPLPLVIGTLTTNNLAFDRLTIQARNNGVASALFLQPWGGQVNIGGDVISQQLNLNLVESKHVTSRRASVYVGSNWIIGQDLQQNGTKDWFLFNITNNKLAVGVNAPGDFLTLNCATIGLVATQWFRSDSYQLTTANGSTSILSIDNTAMTYYPGDLRLKNVRIVDGNPFFYTDIPNGYICRLRRTSDYATLVDMDSSGSIYAANLIQAPYLRFTAGGYAFTHGTDTDTGIYYDSDGQYRLIANGSTACFITAGVLTVPQGSQLRLYSTTDTNHILFYTAATPPGSGEASNGPQLRGYSSVWLHVQSANKPLYLSSVGNVFIATGQSYSTMSSIENKENVIPIDPEVCLDQVSRWQPVEFDVIDDGHHAEGFIAEEHVKITPSMVNVCGPESKRPGWANAVDYAGGTVRLTGAVQALLRRIEELERKVA
jgi:hypothetical protein